MVEPLDTVYISKLATSQNAYHRPDRAHAVFQVSTNCGRLLLMDCDSMPEIEAALIREPCRRCFTVRGRRQRILDLIVMPGVADA